MLLHGLGGSSGNWVDVVPLLAGRNRVVCLDLPGHGRSAALASVGVDGFASAVAATLEQVGAHPAIVAGHSFGGQVAAALAGRRPDLVRALLLVAPSGIRTHSRSARVVVRASTTVRPGRLVAPLSHRLSGSTWFRRAVFWPWLISDPNAPSASATRGFFVDMPLHSDTATAGRAMTQDDPRAGLAAIRCPTIVLWGARDAQLPLDDAFDYTRRLGGRLRVVADCGHLVIGERPLAVADAIAALEAQTA